MPGEFFFMAMGGLGMSLAGFAGLIAAIGARDTADPVQAWRIREIVIGGFVLTHFGFGVVAVYLIVGEVEPTVRWMAAGLAVVLTLRLLTSSRPGPAWSGQERRRRAVRATQAATVLICLACAVFPSAGFLAMLALLAFNEPVGVFVRAVAEVTRAADAA